MSDSRKKWEELFEAGKIEASEKRTPLKSLKDYEVVEEDKPEEAYWVNNCSDTSRQPLPSEKPYTAQEAYRLENEWGLTEIYNDWENSSGNTSDNYEKKFSKDEVGEGLRFNDGKLRYDLLHPTATEGLVKVLTVGANKYAERNWEKGMKWSTVMASLKRHLAAIEKGEDFDIETGELHADHLQCNAHFLSAYYKIFPQGDDRPHNYLSDIKIGLDIDEVLCNWLGDWTDMRGIPTPNSWWFDRKMGEEFEDMKKKGELDSFYLGLKPLIHSNDIPFEPHCYITSRPVDTAITEKWLAMHGFPARPVYTCDINNSKVAIAKREGLDMFVDDGFHNFKELNQAGICCYLMDAPHNQRYDVGHKRIKSLKNII